MSENIEEFMGIKKTEELPAENRVGSYINIVINTMYAPLFVFLICYPFYFIRPLRSYLDDFLFIDFYLSVVCSALGIIVFLFSAITGALGKYIKISSLITCSVIFLYVLLYVFEHFRKYVYL